MEHVSPSQIAVYRACPRKWYFERVLGHRAAQTMAQTKGVDYHAMIQGYYETGVMPDDAALRESSLHWPTRDQAMVELQVTLEVPGWEDDRPKTPPAFILPGTLTTRSSGGWPKGWGRMIGRFDYAAPGVVVDFKTCRTLAYVPTDEAVMDSPQMTTYGEWALQQGLILTDAVYLGHVYIPLTRPFGGVTRGGFVPVDRIRQNWQGVVRSTLEMRDLATARPPVETVESHLDHCSSYGGCPHRKRCPSVAAVPVPAMASPFPMPPHEAAARVSDACLSWTTPDEADRTAIGAYIASQPEPTEGPWPLALAYLRARRRVVDGRCKGGCSDACVCADSPLLKVAVGTCTRCGGELHQTGKGPRCVLTHDRDEDLAMAWELAGRWYDQSRSSKVATMAAAFVMAMAGQDRKSTREYMAEVLGAAWDRVGTEGDGFTLLPPAAEG